MAIYIIFSACLHPMLPQSPLSFHPLKQRSRREEVTEKQLLQRSSTTKHEWICFKHSCLLCSVLVQFKGNSVLWESKTCSLLLYCLALSSPDHSPASRWFNTTSLLGTPGPAAGKSAPIRKRERQTAGSSTEKWPGGMECSPRNGSTGHSLQPPAAARPSLRSQHLCVFFHRHSVGDRGRSSSVPCRATLAAPPEAPGWALTAASARERSTGPH